MPRTHLLSERAFLFAATGAVAAHATASEAGFRQRDIRFFVELFSNWVELSFERFSLSLQNTQIARFTESLVAERFARAVKRKGPPSYRLTRAGLIELISRSVSRSFISQPEHFFFLHYFIKNYAERVMALVQAEGDEFPLAIRLELASLLDPVSLIERESKAVESAMTRLQTRIHDAKAINRRILAVRSPDDFDGAVHDIERKYPYELNSQKPLSELMNQIPMEYRTWELTTGAKARAEDVWELSLAQLETYRKALGRLSAPLTRLTGR